MRAEAKSFIPSVVHDDLGKDFRLFHSKMRAEAKCFVPSKMRADAPPFVTFSKMGADAPPFVISNMEEDDEVEDEYDEVSLSCSDDFGSPLSSSSSPSSDEDEKRDDGDDLSDSFRSNMSANAAPFIPSNKNSFINFLSFSADAPPFFPSKTRHSR